MLPSVVAAGRTLRQAIRPAMLGLARGAPRPNGGLRPVAMLPATLGLGTGAVAYPSRGLSSTAVETPPRPAPPPAHGPRGAIDLAPYDVDCAGARLCREIEAGVTPLPRGFDDVEHFRLFLRLSGDPSVGRPLEALCTMGRLLGMDRASVRGLLDRYARVYGIPPSRRSMRTPVPGLGPGHPIFEDMMALARRDPPVLGRTLCRLVRMPSQVVEALLKEHMPEVLTMPEVAQGVCIHRLRELVTVSPALSRRSMSVLLSCDAFSVRRKIEVHMPEYLDVHVFTIPPGKQQALRAVLADRSIVPAPTQAEVCQLAGVDLYALRTFGPLLHAEYAVRRWGELPPAMVDQLRALLRKRCHSVREMADQLGLPVKRLRWYIKHYEPGAMLPRRINGPLRQLAPPAGLGRLTLEMYVNRFLPEESPIRRNPSVEFIDRLGAEWEAGASAGGAGSEPGSRARAPANDRDLRGVIQSLVWLRPTLSMFELAEHLVMSVQSLRKAVAAIDWPADPRNYQTQALALPREDILKLRMLGNRVHPAGGRMLLTVSEIAAKMERCPDLVYTLLHRYCPEYFFLA
ncbi:hypothetical protein H696_05305, partial [Fonticula alba]